MKSQPCLFYRSQLLPQSQVHQALDFSGQLYNHASSPKKITFEKFTFYLVECNLGKKKKGKVVYIEYMKNI